MNKLIIIVLLIGLTFTNIWAGRQTDNAAQAKKFLELLSVRDFQSAGSYSAASSMAGVLPLNSGTAAALFAR